MRVSQLLQAKGNEVTTVTLDLTALDVATLLRDKRIGAVVVLDDGGRIAGILSERDIVQAMPEHGQDLARVSVGDLMTRDVTTCAPSSSVNEVMWIMTRGRFRHVPVVEGGKLAGLVSIGDLVKARIDELEHEKEALESYMKSG